LSIFITLLTSLITSLYSIGVFLFCRRFCEPEIQIVDMEENDTYEKEKPPSNIEKIIHFSIPAIAQVVAMYLGNKSMEYVDNTTKTLAKSTKPIAILFVGILIYGRRYHFMRYIGILMVTLGVVAFMFYENLKKKEEAANNLIIGIMFSTGSLVMDGIVGSTQDWLQDIYKPSAFTLMFSTNIWAVIISFISLFLFNEYEMTINFLWNYPEIYWDLFIFSIACPIGNQFIFLIIKQFGSLQCSIVTTVRKLITITFNSIKLGRNLQTQQWMSILVVFTGLGFDLYFKDNNKLPIDKQKKPKRTKDNKKDL